MHEVVAVVVVKDDAADGNVFLFEVGDGQYAVIDGTERCVGDYQYAQIKLLDDVLEQDVLFVPTDGADDAR